MSVRPFFVFINMELMLATYHRLAEAPIDWSKVTLWLGDERWVPHDHPESNTRMVRESLAAAEAQTRHLVEARGGS